MRIYKCILYCYPGPRAGLWNYTDTAAADNHASANACSNASTIASVDVNTLSMLMYVPIFLLILILVLVLQICMPCMPVCFCRGDNTFYKKTAC